MQGQKNLKPNYINVISKSRMKKISTRQMIQFLQNNKCEDEKEGKEQTINYRS